MPQTINMKDIWKKYRIGISAGGFLALVVVAWFFAIAPIRRSIESNADEMQKKVIDGEMYAERVSKISEMEKTQATLAESESDLRVFLDKNSEVDFIKTLESIAGETGNKIVLQIDDEGGAQKTKQAPAKKTSEEIRKALPKLPSLAIKISLEGNYEQQLNFLHKLENLNYYVEVVSLGMNKVVVEAPATNPFAAGKKNPAVEPTETEIIKSNLDVVVYLKK